MLKKSAMNMIKGGNGTAEEDKAQPGGRGRKGECD